MTLHPVEAISAYADGELPPEEVSAVEAHLAQCTECARELALIRTMGGAMHAMLNETTERSVWEGVHRRITVPVGWILLIAGLSVWMALALVEWFRAGALTLAWLSTTAVGIGIALLLVGVGFEQYRDWKSSPYRDIER